MRNDTAPDVIGRLSIGGEACDDNIGSICIANRGNGFAVFINGGLLPAGESERLFPASDLRCLAHAYTFALSIAQLRIEEEVQLDSMIAVAPESAPVADINDSRPTMTFDQFRASGRDVGDLREIDGYGDALDKVTPGRVYQGQLCIDRCIAPRTGWTLTLCSDEWHSDDLVSLERKLYQFALSQECITRPPDEYTTRLRWVRTLEAALTTLIEMGGYDVEADHLREALADVEIEQLREAGADAKDRR